MEKKKNEIMDSIISGLKVSLTAFVIHTLVSLIVAIVINIAANEYVNLVLYGGINTSGTTIISKTIRMTYMVFNLSLFNQLMLDTSPIQIGLVILLFMPILAFYLAKKYIYGNEAREYNIQVMLSASVSYALLQWVISMITTFESGKILTFTSIRNIIATILCVFLIQMVMEFFSSSKFKKLSGIHALQKTLVYLGGLIFLMSVGLLIYQRVPFTTSLVVVFNVMAYALILFLGGSFTGIISDRLINMNLIHVITNKMPSAIVLPKYVSILVLICFIAILCWLLYCIIKLSKNNYIQNMLLYAFSVSFVVVILCYCSKIYINDFPLLGQITIEFSLVSSFFMPFIIINCIGWIRYLFIKFKV